MLRDEIENFFLSVSCFETRSRISFFQSHASRQDREFLSLNLVLRDENENFFYQSQTSRRERESRLRQFSREFSRITFIACLMTDIFKKRLLFSQNFLKWYVLFSREIWIKISFFETRTGILFQHLVSRDENGNFFILISCFEKEARI